jgi:hypothetical protein
MVIIKLEKKQLGLLQMQHQVVHPNKSSKSFKNLIQLSKHYFRYIIDQGVIPPLCDLLNVADAKIIQVALNGLDNILKLGAVESKRTNGPNPYTIMIEECYGLDKIESLQSHENIEIYQKAFHLIETYFGVDEEENHPDVKDYFNINHYFNSFFFL